MTEISKYITIIRPEFMTFCKDACRAAALNHLLFRIAYKCKDQPKEQIQAGDVLWYAKTELITSEMSDAWGVCKVRKEVNALLAMNLIGRKSNPTWGVDRTKHFFFGAEQCQVFIDLCKEHEICVVHLDLPVEVKHLIYLSVANDTSIKCTCEKQECEQANDKSIACIRSIHPMHSINLSPANDISIEAITKITTKRSTEDNNEEEGTYPQRDRESDDSATATADRDTHAPDLSQQVDDAIEDVELRRKSGALTSQDDSYSHANQPATISQDAGSDDYVKAQLSTSTASYPQASAKLEPKALDISKLSLKAHTGYAFQWLDAVRKEAQDDPMASYVASGVSKKKIGDLIDACRNTPNEVSETNVRLAWLAMWNAGTWRDGRSWQDPGMLTIEAFCKHYGDYLDRARAAESKKQGKQSKQSLKTPTVSGLKRWTPPSSTPAQV